MIRLYLGKELEKRDVIIILIVLIPMVLSMVVDLFIGTDKYLFDKGKGYIKDSKETKEIREYIGGIKEIYYHDPTMPDEGIETSRSFSVRGYDKSVTVTVYFSRKEEFFSLKEGQITKDEEKYFWRIDRAEW
ncbi:hypothetical protein V6R21_01980 [Limibacter armeniacum]|uniref:hypothetical protein n=1 Tax=Limibacter armeniacum TaxID=466084 RepID=UPI002FE62FB2